MEEEIKLLINQAQQKLVKLAYKAMKKRQEEGCVPKCDLCDLARINSIIDILVWNPSTLTYTDLEQINITIINVGGRIDMPYKDLHLSFLESSILYPDNLQFKVRMVGDVTGEADYNPYTKTVEIQTLGGAGFNYIHGGSASYKGPLTPRR